MRKLFILCGMPGCGKSTWARTFFEETETKIVSSDLIRFQLTGDMANQEKNEEVFATFHKNIEYLLELGEDVVADSTALAYGAREHLRTCAAYANAETHLVFFNNERQALLRNVRRANPVPLEAMQRMRVRFKEARRIITEPRDIMEIESYTSVTIIQEVK